ncbi:hypothetical protein [Mycolicibacterium hodleri]|uniref:Uncharacterized protein n=1 Tax=Mycolicibacterium hodleri TaxID=49897 RepID=A0A502DRU1_9MYCO|nr:hypothetical protein [Mycolicibacterium hodleri]TPG28083.1 hypothetical protein EAH80_28525 [Mycolicibacterium hodleri]
MADHQIFVTAPPGLTATLKDGTQLPIVALRIDGHDLLPYYLESDGSVDQASPTVPVTVAAAWNLQP